MATSHIALLLPQIQLAATDIDEFSADRDADVKLAVRTLSNVTRLARDLATLLEAREEDVDVSRMVELLRDAAAEASTSKTRLINDNVLPKTATKNLRPVMDELTGEIRGLALKLVTT